MQVFSIIVMAIVVESVVDIIKDVFVNKTVMWQKIVSIVLGIVVAIGFGVDLFAMFGLTSTIPYLGTVLSGLLMSRGANYISDILAKITSYKNDKVETLG